MVNVVLTRLLFDQVVEKAQRHHTVKVILLRNVDDYGRRGQVMILSSHWKNVSEVLVQKKQQQ